MVGINGWEFVLLIVIAIVVLGPERMPEYAAKLARFVKQARAMADNARGQLREQMGPEFDDIDWRQYDPRQYDPRRIVREALMEPTTPRKTPPGAVIPPEPQVDPSRPTPFDPDAT
jgi:sec-independent protein translocase protein TatB